VYLRAVSYQKSNKQDFIASLKKFFDANGVMLKPQYLETETERPIYPLAEQLKMLDRAGGKSEADQWFEQLAGYLKSVGTIQEVPDSKTYITREYLEAVNKDPKLKAFANNAK
jgi:NitT/TauT family transport system substrate-binding protein